MILSMHQPEYLPYLGHIAKIALSDMHIFYDDVQYEKDGFQNRNRIQSGDSWQWLTVPVRYKYGQKIKDVRISGDHWRKKHMSTLRMMYGNMPAEIYGRQWENLSALNIAMSEWILNTLSIRRKFLCSSDMTVKSKDRVARIIEICRAVGATVFISGMGAHSYLNEKEFKAAGIRLIFSDWKDPSSPPFSSAHYLLKFGPEYVRRLITRHTDEIRRIHKLG